MTETVNTTSSEGSASELSGIDLARLALHQARQAAKARGESGARRTKRRTRTTSLSRDGREPAGFAAVLQALMTDQAWNIPAAGGSILDQWPDIAAAFSPKLAEHVEAAAFHPETGQLDLRPDSPAYAAQLRLISSRIVTAANNAVGTQAVRTVRVLAVGATTPVARTTATTPKAAAVPDRPVKTRDMASPGFHQALAAHQSVTPARRIDLGVTEAMERQSRAMRELSRRAFPKAPASQDDAPASIQAPRDQRRRAAAATQAAALRRARAERAGGQLPVPQRLVKTA